MDLFSIFKGGKYFDKHIEPKCDYCRFGKRAKDGNKVLCEKRGLVDGAYSCSKFIYSPLKRIPVKQLNFVGSLADEELYLESAGDRAEKEEESKKNEASDDKANEKKTENAQKSEKSEKKESDEKKEASENKEDSEKQDDAPAEKKSEPEAENAEEKAPAEEEKKSEE